jgi:uncharacterized protein YukE
LYKQRAADQAHAALERLQATYGRPTSGSWTDDQHAEWRAAWTAWIDAAARVQAAVTEHARAEEKSRHEVEGAVKRAARHPEAGA